MFSTRASPFKASEAYFFSMKEVIEMENSKKFGIDDWKQKRKDNSSLGAQRLLGIVRSLYCKIKHLAVASRFSACKTGEMIKGYEAYVEQNKAKATTFVLRRQLAIQ